MLYINTFYKSQGILDCGFTYYIMGYVAKQCFMLMVVKFCQSVVFILVKTVFFSDFPHLSNEL